MTRQQIKQDAHLVACAENLGPIDKLAEAVIRHIVDKHIADIERTNYPAPPKPRPFRHPE